MLNKLGWEDRVYKRLNEFLEKDGKDSYCVFDFDNTCVIHDIQEVTYNYMIDNLVFKMDKVTFSENLKKDVAGEEKIDSLIANLSKAYDFLYDNYIESEERDLELIKTTKEYIDFAAELRYLYKYIGVVYDDIIRTVWGTYLFSGFTAEDFREVGKSAVEFAFTEKLEIVKLKNNCGTLEAVFRRGLRAIPEIEELITKLRETGRRVFIVSASHEELVKSYACRVLGFASDEVYGMRSKSKDGIYYGEYEDNYPPTQNDGKSKLIQKFLVPKFDKGPSFVAGDSNGDSFMMKDFADTEICLIIDRNLDGNIAVLKNEIGDKYIVQGRTEIEGRFINSRESIEL